MARPRSRRPRRLRDGEGEKISGNRVGVIFFGWTDDGDRRTMDDKVRSVEDAFRSIPTSVRHPMASVIRAKNLTVSNFCAVRILLGYLFRLDLMVASHTTKRHIFRAQDK